MGGCFSCSVLSESELLPPTAKVVSINGTLRQYSVPAFVSQVLEAEAASSSSSSSSSLTSSFLCNSDFLSYDDYIPALDSNAQLFPNHLYFVLPKSKLQNKLAASDMAALAVKASVALQNASKYKINKQPSRISPVLLLNNPSESLIHLNNDHLLFVDSSPSFDLKDQPPLSIGSSRSGSFRKVQKYTSKRAKLAVRSFRLRLSTIYEGTVL